MNMTFVPILQERLALIAHYQGLNKGEPQFELVEEPICFWQVEAQKGEMVVKPVIAGFQPTEQAGTQRVALYNYDGSIGWNGRQFENLDSFMNDFKDYILFLEERSKNDCRTK